MPLTDSVGKVFFRELIGFVHLYSHYNSDMEKETVNPYKHLNSGKKTQVALMFNNIAKRYDFLNHLLSLGIDKLWRKKAINLLKQHRPKQILDIATGTGDFAIEALNLKPEKIVGVDISAGMLKVGKEKIKKKNLEDIIVLKEGDSENLGFQDNSFDATIVAFGVRNFENLDAGLAEINRVVRPGGHALILEFSKPKVFPIKQLYDFYFKRLLPFVGNKISSDSSAYSYLPESVYAFPDREAFVERLEKAGFVNNTFFPLTFGVATIYVAEVKA